MEEQSYAEVLHNHQPPNAPLAAPALAIDAEAQTSVPCSPMALDVDAWGLRRGRDLIAESERIRNFGTGEFAAAAFFTAAFDPDPRLLDEPCLDPRRKEFLTQLSQHSRAAARTPLA